MARLSRIHRGVGIIASKLCSRTNTTLLSKALFRLSIIFERPLKSLDLIRSINAMPPLLPGDRPARLPAREIEVQDGLWKALAAEIGSEGGDTDCDIMFINNSSDSYRDQKHGNLLVQRAPHQVRPPSDTGVHYWLNEADREFEVSLDSPPQLPDYEWNSVQLKTGHNMCQACLDVFNYYCQFIEARSVVRGPPEPLMLRRTDFGSTKSGLKMIARNSCYQIPSCIISIFSLCLLGQL